MQCPLCRSTDESTPAWVKARPDVRYMHCGVCDLIYLDAQFYLGSDEEKARYAQHNNTVENQGQLFEPVLQALSDLPRGSQILDYGCGPQPVLAKMLEHAGFQVSCFDPFFFPEKEVLEKKYQAITCTEALEHFFRPRAEIEKLIALLDRGGRLIVMTGLHTGKNMFLNWWYARDPTHVCFFSWKSFDFIAKEFGLRMVPLSESLIVLDKIPLEQSAP